MRRNLVFSIFPVFSCLLACADEGESRPVCVDDKELEVTFGGEDTTFHVGPYLGHTTTTSVAIGWETLTVGDTEVEYGLDGSYGKRAKGAPGTMHQVVLVGLRAGTTYHYRACTNGTCTGDLWLTTAPDPSQPIRFSVYGDCQDNPQVHRTMIDRAVQGNPNLLLVVGDLVGDGNVREQYKERFFDPARQAAHYIPRYAAVGNHDRKDIDVVHFRDYVMYPEDPDAPQAETSYSFVYGDAFFLVLDNTLNRLDMFFPLGTYEPPFYQWILAQISSPRAQEATWRFAFAHYPPDSNCREDGYEYGLPERAVRNFLVPMLWEHGFQGYFAGHVHCYERFDFAGGLVITTGGAGGGLEPDGVCDDGLPESRKHSCVHHHVAVELGCKQATVTAVANDGVEIERIGLWPDGTHAVLP